MTKARDLSKSINGEGITPVRNGAMNQDPVAQGESTRSGMSSTIYTGNGSLQSINTGIDMATGDFGGLVWGKARNSGGWSNYLYDTVRGVTTALSSDTTAVDFVNAGNGLESFDNTGYTVKSGSLLNVTGVDYAAWSFQTTKKTTGLTNRNKAYTSHYNPDMGFSIVGYVGDGLDDHEIPHHLGVVPELSIFKSRDSSFSWYVTSNLFLDYYLELANTNALVYGDHILPTDTTFKSSASVVFNKSADDFISYHFASVEGVSKVGKYTGTGAAGNYVDCGFKAGFVLVKNLTSADGWQILDSIRADEALYANAISAAVSADYVDYVEEGFVLKTNAGMNNTLNNEYLFLAFAETSTDATKTKTDYTYPTTADVLSIVQDTHLSYASGYDATGQLDTSEVVGAGTTVTLGAGYENKHLWLYKDKSGAYGTTEYRPLEGLTRNDADKWGVESPLDASLRTNAPHTGYESSTGVASSSAGLAWMAFDKKTSADGNTFGNVTNCWLQYKQTEKRILKSWRMKAGGSWSASPRRFTIEGSNDGLNWTAIDSTYTASDFTLDYSLEWSDIQLTTANTTAYLYHQINITANQGHATVTELVELEFNTILPSDYYLVEEGKMYDSTATPIERVYLAELMTDSDGDVIWFENLPVAKAKVASLEVHGTSEVHGDATFNNELYYKGSPIIETGSNANGSYTKFADGTMICTREHSVTGLDVAAGGPADVTIGSPAATFTGAYSVSTGEFVCYGTTYTNVYTQLQTSYHPTKIAMINTGRAPQAVQPSMTTLGTDRLTGYDFSVTFVGRWF